MIHINPDKLQKAIELILNRSGSSADEALTVSTHLVQANLRGHDSHGVGMIPFYMERVHNEHLVPNQELKVVKDTGSIMMFDGQKGYGQRLAKEAMEQAIARCKETGLVLMTLRNAHHVCRIGTYGEQAVDAGLVSIHFVNVIGHEPIVAPYGGSEGRFVTNPICIAMPGTEKTKPIVLDMATSKIALGKARVAMNKGVDLPEGSMITSEGVASNDPNHMFAEDKSKLGALLPFGEYKGSGLALFCELLGGGLSGGGTIQPENPRPHATYNNMFNIIIDPTHLVDNDWLSHEVDELVDYVKSAKRDPQTDEVLIAGEPERATTKERTENGVPLAEAAWEGIVTAAGTFGVSSEEIDAIIA